eukprot:10581895-Lingulodinium_polyedra.AAC.1
MLPPVGELERLAGQLRAWHAHHIQNGEPMDHFVGPDFEAIGARAERAASAGVQRGSFGST